MNGPADTLPKSDELGVHHWTVPELMVRVDSQPRPPIWQRFSLDPDPDLKQWSRTVANIMYGDFVKGFSKAKAETLRPHQSIAICLELGYDLPYGWIYNLSDWSGIPAIVLDQVAFSRGKIMDLDWNIQFHMDGSMSWHFVTRDDMSHNYGSAIKNQWQLLLCRMRTSCG